MPLTETQRRIWLLNDQRISELHRIVNSNPAYSNSCLQNLSTYKMAAASMLLQINTAIPGLLMAIDENRLLSENEQQGVNNAQHNIQTLSDLQNDPSYIDNAPPLPSKVGEVHLETSMTSFNCLLRNILSNDSNDPENTITSGI